MLKRIKNIFSKGASVDRETADDDLSFFERPSLEKANFDNPNFLTSRKQVIELLSEIEGRSPLCTIQIEGENVEYSSSILGIKIDKNTIILDELIPPEGNAILQQRKALKLFTFHKGIHLSFNLKNLEIGHSRGITYYKAALPERIYYPQRRRSPRIAISTVDIPFNGVAQRTGLSVAGYVFDLSRDGAGIDVPVNRARIQRGDLISNCQIKFEGYVMDFDFNVRFVKAISVGSSKVQIGGVFESLSAKNQSKLAHYIASLEREEIRKRNA